MTKLFTGLFGLIVVLVLLAVIGRIFVFDIVQTHSYSMIPTLVAGDTFLVFKHADLEIGDIAVCKNPDELNSLVVLRIAGVEGSTIAMRHSHLILNDEMKQLDMIEPIFYEDNTSGEQLEYAVKIGEESIGGKLHQVALMDRSGDKHFKKYEVASGLFLIGDNRNRARDSRHFGEVAEKDCIGQAFFLFWPGEDSGDLEKSDRFFVWLQ